jgi:hypothetical protein
VYGHQNESDSAEPLSWEATLNQHCDDIATKHLEVAVGTYPLVPFLPFSKVSLTVQGTTITHLIPTHLRTYTGLPELRDYKCRHHGWDPQVFDLIEWPTLHSCTQMLSFLKRLFTIKLTNDLLPFQEQQFQYNQSPSPLCPSACGCREDLNHFFRCPHRARKQCWQAFAQTLSGTFETWKIDPSLRQVLLYTVSKLADSDPILLDNLTDEYTMLVTTQDTIGQDSLLLGQFSPTWTILQERYLRTIDEPVGHHQAFCGIKALITQTLEQGHCTWLLRNEHLHGTSPFQPHSYKHLHLLAQVTELYEFASMMLMSDRDIFEIPLEDQRN